MPIADKQIKNNATEGLLANGLSPRPIAPTCAVLAPAATLMMAAPARILHSVISSSSVTVAMPQDNGEMLSRLNVAEVAQETMSGGEETRAKIASALSQHASAIFADSRSDFSLERFPRFGRHPAEMPRDFAG